MDPAQMPRSIRNVRQSTRYIDSSDSEEVSGDKSIVKDWIAMIA